MVVSRGVEQLIHRLLETSKPPGLTAGELKCLQRETHPKSAVSQVKIERKWTQKKTQHSEVYRASVSWCPYVGVEHLVDRLQRQIRLFLAARVEVEVGL